MSDFELPSSATTTTKRSSSGKSELPYKKSTTTPTQITEEQNPASTTNPDSGTEEPTKPKYNESELLQIFDDVVFSGEYSEEYVIRGRLKVTFRTRAAGEIEEISKAVDASQANLMATVGQQRSLLNLQYALTFYQGKDLRSLKIEDRAKFIRNIPGPVVGALINSLMKFDDKVYEACKEGEENF